MNGNVSKIGTIDRKLTYIRGIYIILIGPVLFVLSNNRNYILFLVFSALIFIYSLLISHFIGKIKGMKERLFHVTAYSDVLFISIFTYIFGGLDSDIFIIYFFVSGFYGVKTGIKRTLSISLFSLILYSAACIGAERSNLQDFNYLKLVLRDIFLVMGALCVTYITRVVEGHVEARKREFKIARTDKLTGLANRHYLEQKIEEEVDYAEKNNKPLSILMFDLDDFKAFNDTYGHVWGDKLLTLFADIIKQNVRKYDIPVRYGGEEFLIILREADWIVAKCIGNRIRRGLEKQKIHIANTESSKMVTVSCGCAQFPRHSDNIKEIIELADKALYKAKQSGKNIVVSYEEMIEMNLAES